MICFVKNYHVANPLQLERIVFYSAGGEADRPRGGQSAAGHTAGFDSHGSLFRSYAVTNLSEGKRKMENAAQRLMNMECPKEPVDLVIDSDTYNEIDD